jgi:hypothetical protein
MCGAYNEAIGLFMQIEVIEEHNALENRKKWIFFVYFSNKSAVA